MPLPHQYFHCSHSKPLKVDELTGLFAEEAKLEKEVQEGMTVELTKRAETLNATAVANFSKVQLNGEWREGSSTTKTPLACLVIVTTYLVLIAIIIYQQTLIQQQQY